MRREQFLSSGFNNGIALALGFTMVVYIIFALYASIWTGNVGLIALLIVGGSM